MKWIGLGLLLAIFVLITSASINEPFTPPPIQRFYRRNARDFRHAKEEFITNVGSKVKRFLREKDIL